MPGIAELLLIFLVVLIVFGAGKLPKMATTVGKAIEKRRGKRNPTGRDTFCTDDSPDETDAG